MPLKQRREAAATDGRTDRGRPESRLPGRAVGEMPGPPALLLLLLLLLAAGSTGAAPLPQTGAGERARGGDGAAGLGLRDRCDPGGREGGIGPGPASAPRNWRARRGGGPWKQAIQEVSAAGACGAGGVRGAGRGLHLQGRSWGEAMRLGPGRAASGVAATDPSRGRLRYWLWTCCLEVLSLHPFLAVLLPFPDVTCLL